MFSVFLCLFLLLVRPQYSSRRPTTDNSTDSDASNSSNSSQSSGNSSVGENELEWPSFKKAVTRYLFTKSSEGVCRGDAADLLGFKLYAPWRQWLNESVSSVCDGEDVQREERAKKLRTFYAACSMQELTGATLNKHLEGFRERYLKHAHVWPAGKKRDPAKLKVTQGSPKAIFVLGASGSGKTYSTKLRLEGILTRNHWDPSLNFVTIDGGEMREQSIVWNEVKDLVKKMPADAHIAGFKDAFTRISQASSDAAKKGIQNDLIESRTNIIIPDTLSKATCVFQRFFGMFDKTPLCPAMQLYDTLVKKEYDVVLIAINTDKNNCAAQGSARALIENKKYSSGAWPSQTYNIYSFFEAARAAGNKHVFMIADNNNHQKISKMQFCEPHSKAACRRGMVRWYNGSSGNIERPSVSALNSGQIDYPCDTEHFCEAEQDADDCPGEEDVPCEEPDHASEPSEEEDASEESCKEDVCDSSDSVGSKPLAL
eukprot:TRINITY_DN19443_c0_g1_i1.p1 TRINITY_DN19443_c0_g1~~TRINITY_DN19443_c0_g1_i1.p1  ORF type:complete len:485 (-),score=46.42 TRINITY_DN19443_c0_g1_i1:71-1525(-)